MAQSFLDQPGLPLGLRNNNPGNLRPLSSGDKWQGELTPADTLHGFSRFSNIAWGLRALITDVTGDVVIRGKSTIAALISSYAPSADSNQTGAYIQAVCNYTGLTADQPIPQTWGAIKSIVQAIILQENGGYGNMITDSDLQEAFGLLSSEATSWINDSVSQGGGLNLSAVLLAGAGLLYALHKHR